MDCVGRAATSKSGGFSQRSATDRREGGFVSDRTDQPADGLKPGVRKYVLADLVVL